MLVTVVLTIMTGFPAGQWCAVSTSSWRRTWRWHSDLCPVSLVSDAKPRPTSSSLETCLSETRVPTAFGLQPDLSARLQLTMTSAAVDYSRNRTTEDRLEILLRQRIISWLDEPWWPASAHLGSLISGCVIDYRDLFKKEDWQERITGPPT